MELTRPPARLYLAALAALLPAALALYLWNNDFPLGFHYDEPKKVQFILEGDQDFHHPILMLQVARAANLLLGDDRPLDVAILGRTTTAFAAVLLVLASYWLANQLLSPALSLFVACGVALTPMTAMHAHYLKEDVLFAAWAIASLASYVRLLRAPTLGNAVLLGVTTGLAGASQYKAGLLVPLYLLFPLCMPSQERRKLYALGGLAAFVAVDLFVAVNLPMIADFPRFLQGIEHDRQQLADPFLPIRAVDYWCTFYWTHALVPGLTLPLAIMGLAGLVGTIATWTRTGWEWKLLAACGLVFYFVQELSSSKPPPNHERYMIAVAPVLICFAGRFCEQLSRIRSISIRTPVVAATLCAVAYPAVVSLRLCSELGEDTRARARQWLTERSASAVWEKFSSDDWTVHSAAGLDLARLRERGVEHLVISSFGYGPYLESAELDGQPDIVYEIAGSYRELLALPNVEFQPDSRSFGFSNPVVIVVAIDSPEAAR